MHSCVWKTLKDAGTTTAIGTFNGSSIDNFTSSVNDPPKIQQRADFCTEWMDAKYNLGQRATAHDTSSQAPSYASPKLSLTYSLTHLLTDGGEV